MGALALAWGFLVHLLELEDTVEVTPDAATGDVEDPEDVAPDNRFFEQLVTGLSADFVFKGVFAAPDGRLVLVGNNGVVATRSPDDKWSVVNEGPCRFNNDNSDQGTYTWAEDWRTDTESTLQCSIYKSRKTLPISRCRVT